MALRGTFYYFKIHNGVEASIKVTSIEINTNIMRMYRELTDAQREFYLSNPAASVQEVVSCELAPPYVPPTPDVAEYAAQMVKGLKEACHNAVSVTALEFAMAIDKVENITASCYYDITAARQVLTNFRNQSKAAMQVFDSYRPRIEAASTVEAVDELYNQAVAAL